METAVDSEAHLRKAQRTLAEETTRLIHGEEALQQALRITEALFSGDVKRLTAEEVEQGFKDVPSYEHVGAAAELVDLLVAAKISSSKRQAREDIQNGAISINGERITDSDHILSDNDKLDGTFTIVRRGKRNYFMIRYE